MHAQYNNRRIVVQTKEIFQLRLQMSLKRCSVRDGRAQRCSDERVKSGWDEPTLLLPVGACKSVNKDLEEEERRRGGGGGEEEEREQGCIWWLLTVVPCDAVTSRDCHSSGQPVLPLYETLKSNVLENTEQKKL